MLFMLPTSIWSVDNFGIGWPHLSQLRSQSFEGILIWSSGMVIVSFRGHFKSIYNMFWGASFDMGCMVYDEPLVG